MDNESAESKTASRTGWIIYWLCVCACAIPTVFEVFFYYQEHIAVYFYIATSLLVIGGVLSWCLLDSKKREKALSMKMVAAIIFCGPLAVPVYFVDSRGFKSAAKVGLGLVLYIP
ncbi:hypothetical protein BVX99_00515, partial [bacterium F16]